VLAGVVYVVSQQPTPQEAADKAAHPQILNFQTVDASRLVISDGSKTTELRRDGTVWNLVKPIQTPADATRVDGWLDQLSTLTADRVIEGSSDLGQYGLAPPKLNVDVTLKDGKSARLVLGDKTPDGVDYYAQVPDQKAVYLVSAPLGDDLKSALTNPPKAQPTPTPLPTLVPNVTATLPPAATPTPAASPSG